MTFKINDRVKLANPTSWNQADRFKNLDPRVLSKMTFAINVNKQMPNEGVIINHAKDFSVYYVRWDGRPTEEVFRADQLVKVQ